MKTSVFIAAAVLFLFSTSEAQLINGYGVKLGMSYANQDFDYTDNTLELDTKYLSGSGAGVFVEWLKLPLIGVTTEVLYVQKGMKVTTARTTPGVTFLPSSGPAFTKASTPSKRMTVGV